MSAAVASKPTLRFLYPAVGDFASILGMDSWEASMYKDAYDATITAGMLETMRNSTTESFMFGGDSWVYKIQKHMTMMDDHSGSSYGITMRNVEAVAKEGWTAYVDMKVAAYEKRLAEKKATAAIQGLPWSTPQDVLDAAAAADAAARQRADTEEAALNDARLKRRPE
jgi:hypothetical protein